MLRRIRQVLGSPPGGHRRQKQMAGARRVRLQGPERRAKAGLGSCKAAQKQARKADSRKPPPPLSTMNKDDMAKGGGDKQAVCVCVVVAAGLGAHAYVCKRSSLFLATAGNCRSSRNVGMCL